MRSRGAPSTQNTQLTVTQTLTVSHALLLSCLLLTSARTCSAAFIFFEQVKCSVKKYGMYSYRKRIFSWKMSLSIPTVCSRIESNFCFWRWDKLSQIFTCVNQSEWLGKLAERCCKIPGWHWSWMMGILLGILSWNFWTRRGRGCNRRSLRCC